MKLARPRPVLPRKGRPAALGASPSRIAQRVERGAEGRGSKPACAGLDVPEEPPPLAVAPRREATQGVLLSLIQLRSKGRSSNSVFSTTVLVVRATPAMALIS